MSPLSRLAMIFPLSATLGQAAPNVSVYNSGAIGTKQRTIDCGAFNRSAGKLYLSCDVAEAVDGQEICEDSQFSNNVAGWSQITMTSLAHQANAHGQCIPQYINLAAKAGVNKTSLLRLLDTYKKNPKPCPLTTVVDECSRKLGL